MAVDWISLIGENSRMIPSTIITDHSLVHNETEGYKFENIPKEKIFTRWQNIFIPGNALHEHWKEDNFENGKPYIFAPFCGEYIFITAEKNPSGNRIATVMKSNISPYGQALVEESLKKFDGLKKPKINSLSLRSNASGVIEIPREFDLGMGLSSWQFQLQDVRNDTGVAFGVPMPILNECFPDVNQWIIESDNFDTNSELMPKRLSSLQFLVYSSETSDVALEQFLVLEKLSESFNLDFELLLDIFVKDSHGEALIPPKIELETRMILGDRSGSLDLLLSDNSLLNIWIKHSKKRLHGIPFPFTDNELHSIEKLGNRTSYNIFESSLMMMSDYSIESRILMARILTKHGEQKNIEKIWRMEGPIGQGGLSQILEDIYVWRENGGISDFWQLLNLVEGEREVSDSSFRRRICHQILSKSWMRSDFEGILGYIPDLINSETDYEFDWTIVNVFSKNTDEILLRINEIQNDENRIRSRLLLYIDKKLGQRTHWKLRDLIPQNKWYLLANFSWVRPILDSINKRKQIYSFPLPQDAFDWMKTLSPSEYLISLDDSTLSENLKESEFFEKYSPKEWTQPKAIARRCPIGDPLWMRRKEWARLLLFPSLSERIRYQMSSLYLFLYFLSLAILVLSILNMIILSDLLDSTKVHGYMLLFSFVLTASILKKIGTNSKESSLRNRDGWLLIISLVIAISLIFILLRELNSVFISTSSLGLIEWQFENYSIQALDNIYVVGIAIIGFWQINGLLLREHKKRVREKFEFFTSLGIK